MKFTKLQKEIITHRLPEIDCLWGVFEDSRESRDSEWSVFPESLVSVTPEQFSEAANEVAEIIESEFDLQSLSDLQYWILLDSVEGSTYTDIVEDGVGFETRDNGKTITQQYANACYRAEEQIIQMLRR